ncbi:biotin-dependent enzyme [Actinocorallia herbida]|uniref:Biotin-dependent enzyme n=1 Tax=Actinocorallia herbida TaxID=58109 RepID=A0A3N1CWI1_9ACTN|nr:biotin/lipoyl-containing protein [Actinocorallia herbida]ROO85650.1 biotin-dependent enzyme [Actinocorallia herbida]
MSERVSVAIPKVAMSVEEAVFVEWLVPDGATVQEGDNIYSVATDKTDVDVEAAASGVLRHGTAEPEETYPVGTEIGYIET